MQALQIDTGQTQHVFDPKLLLPGKYIQPLLIQGSGMFSSVWVKSMPVGSSLAVNYFETTSGNIGEERTLIGTHTIILPAMIDLQYGKTDKISMQPFHNKPYCEFDVIGGPIYFGIYLTVVESPTALLVDGGNSTPVTRSVKFQADHDSVTAAYPNSVTEVFSARVGGVTGAVVEIITVIYTDSTKEFVLNAARV